MVDEKSLMDIDAQLPKMPVNLSLFVLIVVNLVPLAGVLFLGWSPMEIVFLYWIETAIIGIFNVLKMACVGGFLSNNLLLKIMMIPFFIVHFGMFIAVQGVFIFVVSTVASGQNTIGLDAKMELLQSAFQNFWWSALIIFGSHLFSFFWNYIRQKEYNKIELPTLMFSPYKRVFVQQFVAIFGIWIVMSQVQQAAIWILMIVIVAKTAADVWAHQQAHKKWTPQKTSSSL